MARTLHPYSDDFATLAEQDRWIGQQLAFFHQLANRHTDDASWLALKLTCTRRTAQTLLTQRQVRAKARRATTATRKEDR